MPLAQTADGQSMPHEQVPMTRVVWPTKERALSLVGLAKAPCRMPGTDLPEPVPATGLRALRVRQACVAVVLLGERAQLPLQPRPQLGRPPVPASTDARGCRGSRSGETTRPRSGDEKLRSEPGPRAGRSQAPAPSSVSDPCASAPTLPAARLKIVAVDLVGQAKRQAPHSDPWAGDPALS